MPKRAHSTYPRWMERWRRGRWVDLLVPLGLLLVGLAELATVDVEGRPYVAALQVAAAGFLVLRRRWPLTCATGAGMLVLATPATGPAMEEVATPILFLVVAIYSLARYRHDLLGLGGTAALLAVTFLTMMWSQDDLDWTDVVFVLALAGPPYVFGRVIRRLADQSELLRRNQELVRREAVRAERDRIARELHDVIAHSVSAMVVQTAAAQDLVRTDPEKAERVLGDVAAAGRRALSETGRLLHTIRDDTDELGLGPAPGVARLPELVQEFRSGGLAVDFAADPLPDLSPGLDVSVYRIVQEALTNALKHGAGRVADVRLSAFPAHLVIQASNPVNGTAGGGSGLGLVGIAERVTLLGGRMRHGQDDTGRFALQVTLPLTAGDRS
jgi:signal transduction histidine kinase